MSKKLAIINDLSGFGRCSLTAAISVTSAMGVQACPLPTAILSAQTGFPSYVCYDFTDHMEEIQNEWKKMHVSFDGIYTGFVSNETQIDQILSFVDTFHIENNFLLVDPVMGDDGITYDMFTDSLKEKMISLTKKADIITPNLTELCLLTNTDYSILTGIKSKEILIERILQIGRQYCMQTPLQNTNPETIHGPKEIIVTGIHFTESDDSEDSEEIEYIGNLYITPTEHFFTSVPYIGGSYSGTGDLFASCIAAGMTKGITIPAIMKTASIFLQHAIQDSTDKQVPYVDGVNFEIYLSLLHTT